MNPNATSRRIPGRLAVMLTTAALLTLSMVMAPSPAAADGGGRVQARLAYGHDLSEIEGGWWSGSVQVTVDDPTDEHDSSYADVLTNWPDPDNRDGFFLIREVWLEPGFTITATSETETTTMEVLDMGITLIDQATGTVTGSLASPNGASVPDNVDATVWHQGQRADLNVPVVNGSWLADFATAGVAEFALDYHFLFVAPQGPNATCVGGPTILLDASPADSFFAARGWGLTASPALAETGATVTVTGTILEQGERNWPDTASVVVQWGDGAESGATVTTITDDGVWRHEYSATHAYDAAGVYAPTVVADYYYGPSGAYGHHSESALYRYVVVYDPAGGFVTGGGWIDSPAGAFPADPDLAGRAMFGFQSRYQKGASVPDGSTRFQFHAAGLTFTSTSYDWLVIAGQKAMFKGEGVIEGQDGAFSFMLSATDGESKDVPDTFRIKIWKDGGVVYDNQMGDGIYADATTDIGGGQITVHDGKDK